MARTEVIETTAGEVAAELARRGISPDERVTITLDLEPELIPGRREARARVVAAGLTDADIDRLIAEARTSANRARAEQAAANIIARRKGVTLDGLSIKDLINEGRP
jgi:hypothetical protein